VTASPALQLYPSMYCSSIIHAHGQHSDHSF
jgi:hypothetical protein